MAAKNKGQALFEFMVFLPLFIFLTVLMVRMGNSINGSINQQKVTRGYFYYITKNNSNIPDREDIKILGLEEGHNQIGMATLGWKEKFINQVPYATCYKVERLLNSENDIEQCDRINRQGYTSNFIRLYTFYGICGETYMNRNGSFVVNHLGKGRSGACSIQ